MVHGSNVSNHEDGAFAEIIAAKEGLMARIPNSLSFEEAATFGVGIGTVCMDSFSAPAGEDC